jgi:citrate lyase subunit beta/citryl-CoA lyase
MTTRDDPPVWRSLLYVPVNVEKFVDKAHMRGADAIQLDLEDSIAPSEKERARGLVASAARKVARGGADVGVRINRPLGLAIRDLEAAIIPEVSFIAVTKVDGAAHLRLLCEFVGELEAARGMVPGRVKFIAMVETAAAYFRMDEIARASSRVVALNLGTEDFALDCGMAPEGEAVFGPKQEIVFAARAAGIMPLGFVGTVAAYKDLDAFRAIVRRSKALGFEGASGIHPDQIRILNQEYGPSEAEVAQARRIIAADRDAQARGVGAFELDGRMIDRPIVLRAAKLLAREAAIAARVKRMAAAAG